MNRRLAPLAASAVVGVFFAVHSAAQNPSAAAPPVVPVSSLTKVDASATPLPSTKDLLEKFDTVSGGHGVWGGFTTRYSKGIYQTEDASGFAAIEIFSKSPNKALLKITSSNGVVTREVCDGQTAWIEDRSGGTHFITGAALESRIRQSNFNNPSDALLMAVTGKVLGTEKVGAHTAYVLEFSPQKKLTSRIYFDTESGLPVRADDTLHSGEGEYKVENYMDDYRAVDGAYFAFRMRHVEKGHVFTLRLTQIKNNITVDDAMFLKPASARK
jgi:outer membrane lipoprotein-sorting protein